eukprot:TRINITY_DN3331_c0_g1_i1.p1 TRINITY_DN3331_c0_g1~~TRINITY_DN3331_c0_g1_i1.p1  ORF type:complete len:346 (+),score=83.85 TRINITY_DN3331_c0_g1_i1:47-1084(+)
MAFILPSSVRALQRRAFPAFLSSTVTSNTTYNFPHQKAHQPVVDLQHNYHEHELHNPNEDSHLSADEAEHYQTKLPIISVDRHDSFSILRNSSHSTHVFPRQWNRQNFIRKYSTTAPTQNKKVAVVLSGCGVYDGSEIHEAVSVLVHLSRSGVDAKCFAPDIPQTDLINHIKGSPSADGARNVLTESARIARGKIKPLSQLVTEKYSAVIFPGGYGAAKNLCTFAKDGDDCSVQSDVTRVIKEFHAAKKPIGMLCVSPVIAAKLIPGVKVTLGNEDKDIQSAIEKMGAKSVQVGVSEVVVDEQNNVVTSPAYMVNAPIHKVYEGIGKFVEIVLGLTNTEKTEEIK